MKKKITIHISFIIFFFSRPRIEKDDIIAIKVIGAALNKPNLPFIIFQSWHGYLSVDQALILFLKIDNVFTSLIESGTSSHIFRAKDTRLSRP